MPPTKLPQPHHLLLPPIQQTIRLTFNYPVHFTTGLFNPDNPLLAQILTSHTDLHPKRAIAIIDDGVSTHHPHLLSQLTHYAHHHAFTLCTDPIIVPGGEAAKNDPALPQNLLQIIHQTGLCRHSYLLAIGGGALLDLVGYIAAIAHRGIRLIRIPTTVLAQNDSGIGVKNSINAFNKKNFLGTFAPPAAVLNDFNFLNTLNLRDWRSGIAEAIKVALIKDAAFFDFITTHTDALNQRDAIAMQRLIYRCAQLHLNHIATSGDPFEAGSSRPLDFGHWAAHRLEHLTQYRLRHGEAVAIGIALDSTYSYLSQRLSLPAWQRILQTLKAIGFSLYVPELAKHLTPDHPQSLFRGLSEFQEHLGGELTITLLSDIGHSIEVHTVDLPLYQQAVSILQTIEQSCT
ncbi:3-dehydroquinate synthase [Oculatella sp. LEGE 06141]|uniref:3-dehydroquinate synthase n=1 Tax=Oculatella sp. LEGE 06141 TaxID=1828648 RepID=UPI0018826999|nr:3-dehydroquinate synthase [Oculatella sp. LEGE 06141]MBE9179970.1 3-dehydroquinate synthase [Oculatella sp. LEGE 06141]